MSPTFVRVVVKIANADKEAERVTFDYNPHGLDLRITDIICFGDIHLQVKERRVHVPPTDDAPLIVLHTGVTDRRPQDRLYAPELVAALKTFPAVKAIVRGTYAQH
jgi:hypothetical protein